MLKCDNGLHFECEWKNNVMNGFFKKVSRNGACLIINQVKDGILSGQGHYLSKDRDRYEGDFEEEKY